MATRMTARIPTTPETLERVREEKEARDDVDTYDALLRELLNDRAG